MLPWQAHGGEFANFIVRPRMKDKYEIQIIILSCISDWQGMVEDCAEKEGRRQRFETDEGKKVYHYTNTI